MLFAIVSWMCMLAAILTCIVWLNIYGLPESTPVVSDTVCMRLYGAHLATRTQQLSAVCNIALVLLASSIFFAFVHVAVDVHVKTQMP